MGHQEGVNPRPAERRELDKERALGVELGGVPEAGRLGFRPDSVELEVLAQPAVSRCRANGRSAKATSFIRTRIAAALVDTSSAVIGSIWTMTTSSPSVSSVEGKIGGLPIEPPSR
jgi:hypothetical protein